MSRKGENIYKRKDGRWEGRYIKLYDQTGKAKYGYVYARSYKEVKQKLINKIALIEKDCLCNKSNTLYGDFLDMWLQTLKINIKESTYARYSYLIEKHIKPILGNHQISRISTEIVENFIKNKLTSGSIKGNGPLSPKTVTDILTIVKSSMEHARYNDVFVLCNLSKLTIKQKNKEMRVLCKTEQEKLVSFLLKDMDLSKFGILLSLYTGIRVGELCALRWENIDIDVSNATLRIKKTMQRIQDTSINSATKTKVIITEPKSKSSIRDIPIPDCIFPYVKRFKADQHAYVLTGDNTRYVEPRVLQYKFKRYISICGIENATYHTLRHTFATRCIEVGFEIKSLSEILGHTNVNITLNRYVHSSFDLKYSNMNKLKFK